MAQWRQTPPLPVLLANWLGVGEQQDAPAPAASSSSALALSGLYEAMTGQALPV